MLRRYILKTGWVVFLVVLVTTAVQLAHAHTRTEVGPYAIVVGWAQEPPIIGERNALVIEITQDEQPVTGVEATLDAELIYGGRQFRVNLVPTAEPGVYTADIFPTVRGQYGIRLFGAINDVEVDVVVEPEEVFPADRLHFPQPQPDPIELQKELQTIQEELQAELASARLLALAGLGIGLAGLLMAVLAFWQQRKS